MQLNLLVCECFCLIGILVFIVHLKIFGAENALYYHLHKNLSSQGKGVLALALGKPTYNCWCPSC